MASPETIDFETLLAPISEEEPCGEHLKDNPSPTSPWQQIRGARDAAAEADRLERRGDPDAPDSRPRWREVAKLAPTILAENSKDLTVASYYIEALAREHGFAGLRDGFRLARELVEKFWDGIYPQPDEDGVSTRVWPLTSLNGEEGDGTLIAPIAKIPLTEGSEGPFSLWQYDQAASLEGLDADVRSRRIDQGAVSMEMIGRAVTESSEQFFKDLLDDLEECSEEFEKLGEVLEEKCGEQDGYSAAPPSSNIRNKISECRDAIKGIARDVLQSERIEEGEEEPGETGENGGQGGGRVAVSSGAISSREEAFRTLLRVSEFFRRTEPHTPVSYALEQAVRWGKMSLPELLTELIDSESTRLELFRLIGVQPPAEE